MELGTWQAQVEELDAEILALLNRRAMLSRQGDAFVADPATRQELELWQADTSRRLCALNRGPLRNETLQAILRDLLAGEPPGGMAVTVAFFGPAATFTNQAALAKFGARASYLARPTIADVFDAVSRGQATFGVVPVENSTEGAVTHTLDMFADVNVRICAEVNMFIHHHLLCRCGKEELQVVYSHPQVFGQCRKWLRQHLPQVPLIEVASTAEAAARCAVEGHAGALAGALAAERYAVPVREQNIEDVSGNVTRFLVIGTGETAPTGNDKTSLLFGVKDRVGALFDSLEPFRRHQISLSFIESRPSRRKQWEYHFYVDLLGHGLDPGVREALEELSEHCQFVKILGSYPRAVEPVQ
jgi:chorismate mutase/prephenate dehydratase